MMLRGSRQAAGDQCLYSGDLVGVSCSPMSAGSWRREREPSCRAGASAARLSTRGLGTALVPRVARVSTCASSSPRKGSHIHLHELSSALNGSKTHHSDMLRGHRRGSGEPLTNISRRFSESARVYTETTSFLAHLSEAAVRLVHSQ